MGDYDNNSAARKLAQGKEQSYFRLGLYVYSPQWGHENFCDIHVMFGTPRYHRPHLDSRDGRTLKRVGWGMRAWYSGPNDSIYRIKGTNLKRYRPAMQGTYQASNFDADISAGGSAIVLEVGNFPQARPQSPYQFTNRFHFWLFGPLMIEDRAYGSLFFELPGPFRKGMVFRPFQLRASKYDRGEKNFLPTHEEAASEVNLTPQEKEKRLQQGLRTGDRTEDIMVHTYNQHVSNTTPAFLPAGAHRWEWMVEAYDRFLTRDAAVRKSG